MIRKYKPNKTPTGLANINTIRTTNIELKIWEYLSRYKSYNFVKSELKKNIKNKSELVNLKAKQISASINQAEKYFKIGKDSPIETSPLLLYYGVLSLAKCLVLSGDNLYTLDYSKPENKHHRSHGLSFKPETQEEKIIRDCNSLLKEFCVISSHRNSIGLYNLFRNCFSEKLFDNKMKFNVKDLLSYVPELHTDYFTQLKKNLELGAAILISESKN